MYGCFIASDADNETPSCYIYLHIVSDYIILMVIYKFTFTNAIE